MEGRLQAFWLEHMPRGKALKGLARTRRGTVWGESSQILWTFKHKTIKLISFAV